MSNWKTNRRTKHKFVGRMRDETEEAYSRRRSVEQKALDTLYWEDARSVYDTESGASGYVWRSRHDSSLTVEMHPYVLEGDSDMSDAEAEAYMENPEIGWYVYVARNGATLTDVPHAITDDKNEALEEAEKLRRANDA